MQKETSPYSNHKHTAKIIDGNDQSGEEQVKNIINHLEKELKHKKKLSWWKEEELNVVQRELQSKR